MHILIEAVYYFTRDSKWCASNRGCVLIKDIWYYQGVRDIGLNYFLKQRMAKKKPKPNLHWQPISCLDGGFGC